MFETLLCYHIYGKKSDVDYSYFTCNRSPTKGKARSKKERPRLTVGVFTFHFPVLIEKLVVFRLQENFKRKRYILYVLIIFI